MDATQLDVQHLGINTLHRPDFLWSETYDVQASVRFEMATGDLERSLIAVQYDRLNAK